MIFLNYLEVPFAAPCIGESMWIDYNCLIYYDLENLSVKDSGTLISRGGGSPFIMDSGYSRVS